MGIIHGKYSALYPNPEDGQQYAAVGNSSTLSQTFTAPSSGNYTLTWFDCTEFNGPGQFSPYTVVVTENAGNQIATADFDANATGLSVWAQRTMQLSLPAGSNTLTFYGEAGYFAERSLIDNVQLLGGANTPPVANDQSIATDTDAATNITLTATDPDNDPLTFTVVSQPSHGTLAGLPPNLTYTPAQDYEGSDTFTFKANDGHDDSNIATVRIAVNRPDIAVSSAELLAVTSVVVTYQISANQPIHPFTIGLYWSQSGFSPSDPSAGPQVQIIDPAALAPGSHTQILTIDQPPPTRGLHKPNDLTSYLLAVADPANDIPESDEVNNSTWVCPQTDQSDYGVSPSGLRVPLTPRTHADWLREARNRAQSMSAFLGSGNGLTVTAIIKGGEHNAFEKMDVIPAGNTSWEQLALAAHVAGFWVHAEGVRLCGTDWPLSPHATGPHLDLYNVVP